MKTATGNLTA